MHLRYADGTEEVSRAGDVYHWPATGWTDEAPPSSSSVRRPSSGRCWTPRRPAGPVLTRPRTDRCHGPDQYGRAVATDGRPGHHAAMPDGLTPPGGPCPGSPGGRRWTRPRRRWSSTPAAEAERASTWSPDAAGGSVARGLHQCHRAAVPRLRGPRRPRARRKPARSGEHHVHAIARPSHSLAPGSRAAAHPSTAPEVPPGIPAAARSRGRARLATWTTPGAPTPTRHSPSATARVPDPGGCRRFRRPSAASSRPGTWPAGLGHLDDAVLFADEGGNRPVRRARCTARSSAPAGVGDFDRVRRVDRGHLRWAERHPFAIFPGICRVHRHRARSGGALAEAGGASRAGEELLRHATSATAPAAHAELGDIRRRLGDLDRAEEASSGPAPSAAGTVRTSPPAPRPGPRRRPPSRSSPPAGATPRPTAWRGARLARVHVRSPRGDLATAEVWPPTRLDAIADEVATAAAGHRHRHPGALASPGTRTAVTTLPPGPLAAGGARRPLRWPPGRPRPGVERGRRREAATASFAMAAALRPDRGPPRRPPRPDVRAPARPAGGPGPPARGRGSSGSIAEGPTNNEIATTLHLSAQHRRGTPAIFTRSG